MTGFREPLVRYPIVQYAYVVNDLDEGVRHWVETLGAGPFLVSRNHRAQQHTYRGEPDEAVFSYAFGQSGDVQVQLIQMMDDRPSVYRDMYPDGGEGFHHVACFVPADEVEDEVARFVERGFPVGSTLYSHALVAYMDCRSAIGCFVELYGLSENVLAMFASVRQAHEEWDGVTDPIRERTRVPRTEESA